MHSEADDNGEKHVVLCRVILGSVEKVDLGSDQSHPSSVDFDTGADDPNNPTHHVVWFSNVNTHVLPECVVSFKASNNVKGKYSFPFRSDFYAKLCSFLRSLWCSNMSDERYFRREEFDL